MAISVFLFSSCNKNIEPVENEPTELHLSSGISMLKSANTQGTTLTRDETVSVWVNDATTSDALYKANQLTSDGNNTFTGGDRMYFPETGNPINIYAIHGEFSTPFSKGDSFPTTAITYSVSSDQSESGGENFTNSDLLYACTEGVERNGNPTNVCLLFYHMLAKLELAIKLHSETPALAETNAVTLGNDNIIKEGKFTPSTTATLTNQTERAAMLANTSMSSTTVQLGQLITPDFESSTILYNEAILVPQDMSGKEIIFTLSNGNKLKYTIPENTIFESGKKYQYQITVNLNELQVTSAIVDWEPVTPVEGIAHIE